MLIKINYIDIHWPACQIDNPPGKWSKEIFNYVTGEFLATAEDLVYFKGYPGSNKMDFVIQCIWMSVFKWKMRTYGKRNINEFTFVIW